VSGSFIGGAIGATIGFFASGGNPYAVQAGFIIGSGVGASFDSLPDQQGPRLSDLSVQSSEYGKPIPIIYGTIGLSGNIIWATEIVEVRTDTQTGGGGKGGGPSQTTTTYAYFGNFAVAICEGEVDVLRMWAGPDKRLIWDGDASTTEGGTVRAYTGSDSQLPDPLMESALGIGNVPAYRGTAYVVFENFPLANDGNRLPFLTIEVSSRLMGNFESIMPAVYLGTASTLPYSWQPNVLACYDPVNKNVWSMQAYSASNWGQTGQIYCNSDITMSQVVVLNYPIENSSPANMYFQRGQPNKIIVSGGAFGPMDVRWEINADAKKLIGITFGGWQAYGTLGGSKELASPAGVRHQFRGYGYYTVESGSLQRLNGATHMFLGGVCAAGEHFVTCYWGINVQNTVVTRWSTNDDPYAETPAVVVRAFENYAVGDDYEMAYDSDRQRIILYWSLYDFVVLDIATGAASEHTFFNPPGADTVPSPPPNYSLKGSVVYASGYYVFSADANGGSTGTTLWLVNPSTLVCDYTFTYETPTSSKTRMLVHPLLVPGTNKGYLIGFDQDSVKRIYYRKNGSELSMVVADLSDRAGIGPGQYNTLALTDTVDGYAVARQTSVRGAIDALRPAYYFDAVESDGVIKYVKRGGAVAVVIPDDDLAAHEVGQDSPDPFMVTRQMESELPRAVYLNHLLAATEYSPSTKFASRLIGASGDESTLDVPMVLSDTKAQEAAEVNLHVAWTQRLTYEFSLPLKYSYLEPTDVVVVKDKTMRIQKMTRTPQGVIKVSAVADAANFYQPNVVVAETSTSGKTIAVAGETFLELM
jgi:hypothetical protein